MFEAEEMEGCHSCKYGEDFDIEKEPCKHCYGLSSYTKKESIRMNRDLSKFEPPKAEPDGHTKELFGRPMEKNTCEKPVKIPFTEDQFFRIITNARILSRDLYKNGYGRLQETIDQLIDYAGSCHEMFASQFHHNPRARRICPNPECHSIYAYFYEDFLYCPKCGTKLEAGTKEEK